MVMGVDGRPEHLLLANESKAVERTVERVLSTLTSKYLQPRTTTALPEAKDQPGPFVNCAECGRQVPASQSIYFLHQWLCPEDYKRALG